MKSRKFMILASETEDTDTLLSQEFEINPLAPLFIYG